MTTQPTDERAFVRAALLERFVPQAVKRILDTACGEGILGERLKQRAGVTVVGVDSDEEALLRAGGRLDEVALLDWNKETPGYPEGAFECIIADTLFERLRDPERVMKRLVSLLAPNGVLVATVANLQYYRYVTALAEGRWIPAGSEDIPPPGPIRFYTAFELTRLVRDAGLSVRFCAPLERDPVEELPLDEEGVAHVGTIDIGPLSPAEHIAWLTRRYVLFGMRENTAGSGAA